MEDLAKKVALVTGAGGGIGAETSALLASLGAIVIVADIDSAKADDTVTRIRKQCPEAEVQSMVIDVTKPESCKKVVDDIVKKYGSLDALAHCAGVLANGPFASITQSSVDHLIDVNLKGTLYIMQPVGEQMLAQKSGKICCVASKAGKEAMATLAHYSASKFGVIGLVQAAAKEWGPQGVYVNAVCPGEVDTEMLRSSYRGIAKINNTTFEEQVNLGCEMSLIGRLQPPENIAKNILFLLSDDSSEIIGQALNCDGGVVFH